MRTIVVLVLAGLMAITVSELYNGVMGVSREIDNINESMMQDLRNK